MHDQTQGLIDLVITLFINAQRWAILRTGEEQITETAIKAAAEDSFHLLAPALKAFREGDEDAPALYADIRKMDVLPKNIEPCSQAGFSPGDVQQPASTSLAASPPPGPTGHVSPKPKKCSPRSRKTRKGAEPVYPEGSLRAIIATGKQNDIAPYEALRAAHMIIPACDLLGDPNSI